MNLLINITYNQRLKEQLNNKIQKNRQKTFENVDFLGKMWYNLNRYAKSSVHKM